MLALDGSTGTFDHAPQHLGELTIISWIREPGVDRVGGVPSFANRPHDERRTTAGIASGENSGHARAVRVIGRNVSASVQRHAEVDQSLLFTGPVKPIASSTSRVHSKSVPAIGEIGAAVGEYAALQTCAVELLHSPVLPENAVVATLHLFRSFLMRVIVAAASAKRPWRTGARPAGGAVAARLRRCELLDERRFPRSRTCTHTYYDNTLSGIESSPVPGTGKRFRYRVTGPGPVAANVSLSVCDSAQ